MIHTYPLRYQKDPHFEKSASARLVVGFVSFGISLQQSCGLGIGIIRSIITLKADTGIVVDSFPCKGKGGEVSETLKPKP